jgi:hypothetical protein
LSNEQLKATIDNLSATIGDAQKLHYQRFPVLNEWLWPNSVVKGSYSGEVDYLKSWVLDRSKWLDGVIGAFISKDEDTSVIKVPLLAFPNPVRDKLNISYPSNQIVQITLFDARGSLIKTNKIATANNAIELDANDLAQGLYLFQIKEGGKIVGAGKFVKM